MTQKAGRPRPRLISRMRNHTSPSLARRISRRLRQFLGVSLLTWGALLRFHPRGKLALLTTHFAVFKAVAGALSPLLAPYGAVLGLFAWRRGERAPALAALAGSALAADHVARVIAPHDAFAEAFGDDWEAQIPSHLRDRFRHRRWPARPPGGAPPHHRADIPFASWPGGAPLLCDLWLPPAGVDPTGLGLIYLHGSAWHYIDKDVGTRPFFRALARQGHVVMDVAYTLSPRATMQKMVGDVKRAIAWLKEEGGSYGVDPERIVLAGGSAGGHLALLAAYTPNEPDLQPAGLAAETAVAGVVAYYGFADLAATHRYFNAANEGVAGRIMAFSDTLFHRLFEEPLRRVGFIPPYGRWVPMTDFLALPLGGTPADVPAAYARFSPQTYASPHCPPTLFLQGEHDVAGMVPQMRHLHQTLRAAGATSLYVEFPQTQHGFDLFFPALSPAAGAAFYDLERFLGLLAVGVA